MAFFRRRAAATGACGIDGDGGSGGRRTAARVGTAATVGVDVCLNWPKSSKKSIRDYGCDSFQNYVLLSG